MSTIFRHNDSPQLRKHLKWLLDKGFDVRRPSDYHVKIGPVNYFPSTGRVTTDPCHTHQEKGFEYFVSVVRRHAMQVIHVKLDDLD